VTVSYATADGTATAGSDYTATAGTLTFAPGVTSQTLTVAVLGDTRNEANETFFMNLSTPSNATIADGQGQGTILNDDSLPTLSINNVTVTEGNTGTTPAVFTVTLSAASSQTVTVNYATADGKATAGSDYTATAGTLTFTPGTTSQTITVAVLGDTVKESTETFFVNLSNATNATIASGRGRGTILDNDKR
jgi:large repetitive protein